MKTIGIAGPVTLEPLMEHLNIQEPGLPLGQGGTAVTHLVGELLRRGRKVVVFTLDRSVDRPICLEGPHLKVWVVPLRFHHRARDFFAVERRFLRDAILQERSDFIHAHWTYEYALAGLESGLPTLVTARDAPLFILRYDHSPYRIIRTLMAFKTLRIAKFMTAVSDYVADHLKRVLYYRGDIAVIPNGTSEEVFSLFRQPRRPGKKIVFASIMNGWGGRKNGGGLLRAFSFVKKKMPSAELWMWGSGYGSQEAAESWAMKREFTEGVRFLGKKPYHDLMLMLAKDVDVLVHPSFEDAFANAILEGLAVGLPVIAGINSGGVSRTLGYGEAGRLVDISSPSELATAMLELGMDERLRLHFRESGHAYALEHFSISHIADQYEQVYGWFD